MLDDVGLGLESVEGSTVALPAAFVGSAMDGGKTRKVSANRARIKLRDAI